MKPRDYLAKLKAKDPPQQITEADLPDWLKSQWQEAGQSIDELLRSVNKGDWAESLLDRLRPRLPKDLCDLFDSGFIALGAIGDPSPNAYMKRLDQDGYAIIFHTGLKDFIYRVARILATRFVPNTLEGPTVETNEIQETARLIAEVFWWFQETNTAFGPDYPIDQKQIEIANLLALEAETFLLAHEIGHVIDDGSKHQNTPFLNLSETLPFDHREEHTADVIGLHLVMESHNKQAVRDSVNTPLIYAGAEFALQIYHGLEILGFEFTESHPATANRLECLRLGIRSKCANEESWQQLVSLSSGIESIFAEILAIIRDPAEHEQFFEREAHRVVSDLEDLLDRCTGGMVPNYSGFYTNAGRIFDCGYSHKMLERVAEVAAAFFTDVQQFEKDKSRPDHEGWVRFQKFKLLWAYIMRYMNEPARSIFVRAFEESGFGG